MGITDKNLCDSCTNIGCEFQSGIVRTKCAFYMPPQLEPDNCGNYVAQVPTTKNNLGVDYISRQEVLRLLASSIGKSNTYLQTEVLRMSSVKSIRPKGHWIWELDETPSTPISPYELNYAGWVCSCCHKFPDDICEWENPDEPPTYKFCPNCGADNSEVEE